MFPTVLVNGEGDSSENNDLFEDLSGVHSVARSGPTAGQEFT